MLVAVAGLEVVNLRGAARELAIAQARVRDAAATLGTNPAAWTPERITLASSLASDAAQHSRGGIRQLGYDPLLHATLPIPWLGAQARATVDLADAVSAASTALGDEISVATAYSTLRGSNLPASQALLKLLEAGAGPLEDADQVLQRSVMALDSDSRGPLVGPLAQQVNRALATIRPRLGQVHAAATAARLAPSVLGSATPARYLVLFANPSELRPAGGYVGAAGSLEVRKGTPTLKFRGTETFDPALVHQYPIPYPLDRYLVFTDDSLGLGDAGWDPDFPTTARLSEDMFTRATGDQVVGTIQVDPYAVAALLRLTGPVEVPGYGSFDAANFFARLNFIVNAGEGPGTGKAALAPITEAVVRSVLAQPVENFPRLLSAINDQLRGRHVLLYLHAPDAARVASAGTADGAILNPKGDYLMVDDANVGATKGDFYVKRSIEFKAEIAPGRAQRHRVVLPYDMPRPVDDADERLNPARSDEGAYHDYLRVYLPDNATVTGISYVMDGRRADGKLDVVGFAHGHEFVGAFARVPRGHTLQLTLDYSLPATGARDYHLYVQKQAGVLSTPLSVDVSYPGGRYARSQPLVADVAAGVRW
ncbi:MAG: DUF4012 domain-containing protein [Candidatus Dormibacteraeota bacterium]|nr:DUF4012 domain-containing protein [Candidatus Dormibacteraeota bacterium]